MAAGTVFINSSYVCTIRIHTDRYNIITYATCTPMVRVNSFCTFVNATKHCLVNARRVYVVVLYCTYVRTFDLSSPPSYVRIRYQLGSSFIKPFDFPIFTFPICVQLHVYDVQYLYHCRPRSFLIHFARVPSNKTVYSFQPHTTTNFVGKFRYLCSSCLITYVYSRAHTPA